MDTMSKTLEDVIKELGQTLTDYLEIQKLNREAGYKTDFLDGKISLLTEWIPRLKAIAGEKKDVVKVLTWLSDESDFDLTGRNYYNKEDHDGDFPIDPKDIYEQYLKSHSTPSNEGDFCCYNNLQGGEQCKTKCDNC